MWSSRLLIGMTGVRRSTCWTLEEDLRHLGVQEGSRHSWVGQGREEGGGWVETEWGWWPGVGLGEERFPHSGEPTHGGGIGWDRRGPLGDHCPWQSLLRLCRTPKASSGWAGPGGSEHHTPAPRHKASSSYVGPCGHAHGSLHPSWPTRAHVLQASFRSRCWWKENMQRWGWYSGSRDLPRGLGGPPGEVGVRCSSRGGKNTDSRGTSEFFFLNSLFSFCSCALFCCCCLIFIFSNNFYFSNFILFFNLCYSSDLFHLLSVFLGGLSFFFSFSSFLPRCAACGVLVPRPWVGPESLWWECQVQATGLTENFKP